MWLNDSNEMVRRALHPANPDRKVPDQVVQPEPVSQPKTNQGSALMDQIHAPWFIFEALHQNASTTLKRSTRLGFVGWLMGAMRSLRRQSSSSSASRAD